jgi:hypothetical protein
MKILVLATSMFAATLGCSTLNAPQPRRIATAGGDVHADMRGERPVRGKRARALLSGPALISHLETEGQGVVTLYLADDPGIGDRTCPSAAAEDVSPVAVLGGQSRITDLAVPEGTRVCAAVTDARSMRVSWHAQGAVEPFSRALDLALLQL